MALPDAPQGDDDGQSCSRTPPPVPPPPPLSINRLVGLYPRERLVVHPLRWTDRQLALLGCHIHDHDEEAHGAGTHESIEATKATEAASSEPDGYARFLARRLSRSFDDRVLADTVRNLIWPLGGRTSVEHNRGVSLYFDQRSRARIRFCRLSVSVPDPDAEIISLACIDYHDIVYERRQHFKPPSTNPYHTDWPGLRRAGLLTVRHTPKEPERDPFLVALAIALGQKERRNAAQPLPSDSSFTVRILVAGVGRPTPFHLYVAHVQARFLDKLDFPSQEPAVDSGLDIGRWHIAAEPFQTLPHRLCRALRPGRYQETDANLCESWARVMKKRKWGGALDKGRSPVKRKQL